MRVCPLSLWVALLLPTTARADIALYQGGARWATLENDGDVYVQGARVGRVEPDGDVYLRGNRVGRVEPDGDVYLRGSRTGIIARDGDIYVRGARWGRARGCASAAARRWVAAVLFFFPGGAFEP